MIAQGKILSARVFCSPDSKIMMLSSPQVSFVWGGSYLCCSKKRFKEKTSKGLDFLVG